MKNTPLMRFQTLAQLFAMSAALLLAGCGGGGGGASAPPATTQTDSTTQTPAPTTNPQPPTPQTSSDTTTTTPLPFPRTLPQEKNPRDPFTPQEMAAQQTEAEKFRKSLEYNPTGWTRNGYGKLLLDIRSNHLEDINAHWAHARGATGAGEVVAVTDIGFDITAKEIKNKITPEGEIRGAVPFHSIEHGTDVASVLAAERSVTGGRKKGNMQGVAFDADLVIREIGEIDNPGGKYVFDLNRGTEAWDRQVVTSFLDLDYARKHNAAIVNISVGLNDSRRINEYSAATIREKLKHTADHLAQTGVKMRTKPSLSGPPATKPRMRVRARSSVCFRASACISLSCRAMFSW